MPLKACARLNCTARNVLYHRMSGRRHICTVCEAGGGGGHAGGAGATIF